MKVLLCSPYNGVLGGISRWTEHIVQYYNSNKTDDLELEIFSLGRKNAITNDTPLIKRILYGFAEYKPLLKKYRT